MKADTFCDAGADRCPSRMMQEGETAKAYAAFQAYFKMGDARTLPELVKKWDGSKNSVYLWAKKYRWDGRIDAVTSEVAAIYRRETEKQAVHVADVLARQRLEIATENFRIAKAFQAKAEEVLRFVVVRDIQTSADGKTITIKSNPNIRLGDAIRLGVGANVLMNQADAAVNPLKVSRAITKPDGSPVPLNGNCQDAPAIEFWLDGGDGNPLPLSQMPKPDELDPNFHPDDDETSELPNDFGYDSSRISSD